MSAPFSVSDFDDLLAEAGSVGSVAQSDRASVVPSHSEVESVAQHYDRASYAEPSAPQPQWSSSPDVSPPVQPYDLGDSALKIKQLEEENKRKQQALEEMKRELEARNARDNAENQRRLMEDRRIREREEQQRREREQQRREREEQQRREREREEQLQREREEKAQREREEERRRAQEEQLRREQELKRREEEQRRLHRQRLQLEIEMERARVGALQGGAMGVGGFGVGPYNPALEADNMKGHILKLLPYAFLADGTVNGPVMVQIEDMRARLQDHLLRLQRNVHPAVAPVAAPPAWGAPPIPPTPIPPNPYLPAAAPAIHPMDQEYRAKQADLERLKAVAAAKREERPAAPPSDGKEVAALQKQIAEIKRQVDEPSVRPVAPVEPIDQEAAILAEQLEKLKAIDAVPTHRMLDPGVQALLAQNEAAAQAKIRQFEEQAAAANMKRAQQCDLCFLMDCTGSMGSYIAAAQTQVTAICEEVKKDPNFKNVTVRMAFIGYRDFEDAKRFEVHPFTEDHEQIRQHCLKLVATGGGDAPEDIQGALKEALKLEWKSPTRILILIADAPCHGGDRFHTSHDDHKVEEPDARIDDLLPALRQKRIQFAFGKINESTDKMISVFREVYETNNGFELKQVMIGTDAKAFLPVMVTTITQGIRASAKSMPVGFIQIMAARGMAGGGSSALVAAGGSKSGSGMH